MFCKNCGRQLSDTESFCPGCGTKRPGGDGVYENGRSSADMKNLPYYTKENDLHQPGQAVDSGRKKFSLSDSGQKSFSLSGQNKFSLSNSGRDKFNLSGGSRKDAGDGIVRISASREPAAPPKEPTGFVNPLKDSGKTVFRSGGTAAMPVQENDPAGQEQTAKPEQAASQNTAAREPNAILEGGEDGGPTGFVNPLRNSDRNIEWGSDGDRNQGTPDVGEIDSHMGFAIFSTVIGCCSCFSFPLGIAAIICASQVSKHMQDGNFEQAKKSADMAQTLGWISIGLWLLGSVIGFLTGGLAQIIQAFTSP